MEGDRFPRNMARSSKLVSLEEAVSTVSDGMTVAVGGLHSSNSPMALVRELVRQGRRGLRVVPNVSAGMPVDLMIGVGAVKSLLVCYIGLEDLGLAPSFRRAAEQRDIEIEEGDEPYLIGGLMAGAADQPFFVLPKGHGALSNAELNDRFRLVEDPYSGEEVYVAPPIQPDVALIHAAEADPYGNARLHGSVVGDALIARAATRVIVTTERIISLADTKADGTRTTIPGFMVDAVVWCPYGAHPNACHGVYLADEPAIREYRDMGAVDYRAHYIDGVDHWGYLQSFDVRRLLTLQQNPAWLSGEGTED